MFNLTESQITTANQSIKVKLEQENALNLKIYVDFNRCTGCGVCAEVCPFGLYSKDFTGKYTVNAALCTECSACKRNCPAEAVIMVEQQGCGCLWNVKSNEKNKENSSCEENAVETETSCCSGGNCN